MGELTHMKDQILLFERHGLSLGWSDVQEGLRRRFLTPQEAVLFAEVTLPDYKESQTLQHQTDILLMVDELASHDRPAGEDVPTRRWRYALLKDLLAKGGPIEDTLVAIERLWADFDYPVEMKHLMYYMPTADGYD